MKQKQNIEWSEMSINAITGCNGPEGQRCYGCYAERIAMRFAGINGYPADDPFRPTWHPHRLKNITKRRKATVWFFGSMCEWLDDGVESSWRRSCLGVMAGKTEDIFITLTKQYKNLWKAVYDSPGGIDRGGLVGVLPKNVILGISVTKRSQVWGINELKKTKAYCKVISFEPLLEDISNIVYLDGIDWIIIGARSKQPGIGHLPATPAFKPPNFWVKQLIKKAQDAGAYVFLKPNLGDYVSDGLCDEKMEEYPFEMVNGFLRFKKRIIDMRRLKQEPEEP